MLDLPFCRNGVAAASPHARSMGRRNQQNEKRLRGPASRRSSRSPRRLSIPHQWFFTLEYCCARCRQVKARRAMGDCSPKRGISNRCTAGTLAWPFSEADCTCLGFEASTCVAIETRRLRLTLLDFSSLNWIDLVQHVGVYEHTFFKCGVLSAHIDQHSVAIRVPALIGPELMA